MKLGILSQDIRLYSTSRLFETAKKRGHDTEVVSYLRCYMNIAKAKPRIFFQAEDGIRDQPRSRGLGDVYKRQKWHRKKERSELLVGRSMSHFQI